MSESEERRLPETLKPYLASEEQRLKEFPVARDGIFMAHAGVCILPQRVVDVMKTYLDDCCTAHQESGEVWRHLTETRAIAAQLIGAKASEIALLGPTSMGLSLVANGLPWKAGDEVICYQDDYPANVYPWMNLERLGVKIRFLQPERPGEITPELVEQALTENTRMVALASCHYLTGFRIDVEAIGKLLRARGIWFCLDGIQSLGAFQTRVEHVDFLSADAHKWMLGPLAAGIFYVREELQEVLRPSLIGAWNVNSPNFIAQDQVSFEKGGRRYEPGVLNAVGIYGMRKAIEMLMEIGIDVVSERLLGLKSHLLSRLKSLGFVPIGPENGPNASSITTVCHSDSAVSLENIFQHLSNHGVSISLRHNRAGEPHLRFSPHFYNSEAEIERVIELIRELV